MTPPPGNDSDWGPLLLPFIYYGYCIASSGRSLKGLPLLFPGILAHLVIIVFCWQALRHGGGPLLIGPIILAPCWLVMVLQKRAKAIASRRMANGEDQGAGAPTERAFPQSSDEYRLRTRRDIR